MVHVMFLYHDGTYRNHCVDARGLCTRYTWYIMRVSISVIQVESVIFCIYCGIGNNGQFMNQYSVMNRLLNNNLSYNSITYLNRQFHSALFHSSQRCQS